MHAQRRRRTFIATVIAVTGILAVLISIGVYGLLRGPASTSSPSEPTSASVAPAVRSIAKPRSLPTTTSPENFARSAAIALFRWDTRGPAGPMDWAQALIDAGDRDEAAGLAADIRGYHPTSEQWAQLKVYGTRQWLSIDSARVPAAWTTVMTQAAPGQLPPGAAAYTISGVRHRDGLWNGEPIMTRSEVTFTIFIACPRVEGCRLLRLSRLNEPLE